MIELFKFIVQPVLVRKEGGEIVAEQSADPIAFYSVEQAREWLDGFEEKLADLNGRASA